MTTEINTEIDKDHFCGGNFFKDGWCLLEDCVCVDSCEVCHRKWPTPKEFEKEYAKKYPDDGAIYSFKSWSGKWISTDWTWEKNNHERDDVVVCACTPWGCPPNDWRPGE